MIITQSILVVQHQKVFPLRLRNPKAYKSAMLPTTIVVLRGKEELGALSRYSIVAYPKTP